MNKTFRKSICTALAAILTALPMAQASAIPAPNTACVQGGVAFGFFNGVQTSSDEAGDALGYLEAAYGSETAKGEPIVYESFYNYSKGFEDFVETFDQRLQEQGGVVGERFELFSEALRGSGSMLDAIRRVVPALTNTFTALLGEFSAFIVRTLTSIGGNPPTLSNYAEHVGRIDALAAEGRSMMFLAHSQGNLFVNQAYQYAVTKVGAQSVKVVHAAPASPRLNGDHTLADLDLVINGLRLFGTVPDNTDPIPNPLARAPGVNQKTDPLGHGLLEIYLNPTLAPSKRLKTEVSAALASLVQPEAQATSGFLTATLTWDGSGDVDLHTDEPDGSHVFYGSRAGTSGYLDVDNTWQNGPEHYYASCDTTRLQPGVYNFSVANFGGAEGRNVRLQVSSANGGVLGTRTAVLGAPTYNVPSIQLMSVRVDKDPVTGEFTARLVQ